MRDKRTELMQDENRRPASRRGECSVSGCKEPTTEYKPYCIEHIDRVPHASAISDYLKDREVEERRAARRNGWKHIDVNGSRAREIVNYLVVHGAQSPKRLAINIEIAPAALEAYLVAMERAKLVKRLTLGSRRGTPREVVALWERAA